MNSTKSLYELLGDDRLKQLLRTFYDKVFSSALIGGLFNHTQKEVIMDKQFCFLTQFLGGPPRYNEKYGIPKMKLRHMPHKIDEAAKNEWLKLMKESIDSLEWDEDLKIALYNCFPNVAEHMRNS
jgi:hemoglobin